MKKSLKGMKLEKQENEKRSLQGSKKRVKM
jgi:hypothetical protein